MRKRVGLSIDGESCAEKVIFELLKALVIIPNIRTKEVGDLLAVARAEARKREHVDKNPPIRALVFVPELQVYCAIYEAQDRGVQKPGVAKRMKH